MAFNSISFILFFLLVFGLYWAWAVRKLNWRNIFILLASYGFYAAWDWRFLSLIFISSLSDYFLAQKIEKASKSIGRR